MQANSEMNHMNLSTQQLDHHITNLLIKSHRSIHHQQTDKKCYATESIRNLDKEGQISD